MLKKPVLGSLLFYFLIGTAYGQIQPDPLQREAWQEGGRNPPASPLAAANDGNHQRFSYIFLHFFTFLSTISG